MVTTGGTHLHDGQISVEPRRCPAVGKQLDGASELRQVDLARRVLIGQEARHTAHARLVGLVEDARRGRLARLPARRQLLRLGGVRLSRGRRGQRR